MGTCVVAEVQTVEVEAGRTHAVALYEDVAFRTAGTVSRGAGGAGGAQDDAEGRGQD